MSFQPSRGPSELRRPFARPATRAEPSSQPTHLLVPISDPSNPSNPSDPSDLSQPAARVNATGSRSLQPNADDRAIVGERSARRARRGQLDRLAAGRDRTPN
jgi:hypothetical protein